MNEIFRAVFVIFCLAISWHTANTDSLPIQLSQRCLNPNQRPGKCVSVDDCRTLLSVLERQPLNFLDIQFLRESQCNGDFRNSGRRPFVCCSSDTDFTGSSLSSTSPQSENSESNMESAEYGSFLPDILNSKRTKRQTVPSTSGGTSELPQPPVCGNVSVINRIYGGQDADLFEFPWMVRFEYSLFSGTTSLKCAGSLISDEYVLTAAHCVTGYDVTKLGTLTYIRLGTHDIVVDCYPFICSPVVYRVGIRSIVWHEGFVNTLRRKENDIALVRLHRRIQFSNAVQPICLPGAVENKSSATITSTLTVAGWGLTLNRTNSAIKQKLNVALYDQKKCREKFLQDGTNILDSHVCAGGEFNEDSCKGDSGGPLMRFDSAWILEGIVSFGKGCGLWDWPGVYTRVSAYENWINQNINLR